MPPIARTFYQYLGLHSLLIGIFPFFIPVFLWEKNFGIGAISIFIGAGGAGFCIGLWIWDRLRHVINLPLLIAVSFVLELILLLNVEILAMSMTILVVFGIIYGIYNSFFWTTQRALFFERVNHSNSGRAYGNLQIYVGFLLQVGIFVGALLLEKNGFSYILGFSALLCVAGILLFFVQKPSSPDSLCECSSVTFGEIFRFRDGDASRLIFIVDGIYLFLESFFWVISLFLLAHESFRTLGLMVLGLAAVFGLLFYLLKNTIDRLGRRRIYRFAVVLYALSWVLRAYSVNDLSLVLLFFSLVLITFCTSFFRLAMNKRFYDLARETLAHKYLILKSYYSQMTIAVVFVSFGLFTLKSVDSQVFLTPIYWAAAAGSLVFMFYGSARYDQAT